MKEHRVDSSSDNRSVNKSDNRSEIKSDMKSFTASNKTLGTMRLQKYIAAAGIASRRKAEELIATGQICVNGEIVAEMGIKVSQRDIVTYNGKQLHIETNNVYIMLNKPSGVVTTANDQFGRKTVLDCVDGVFERIFPVGRLDYDTSGLLILTNDGDLANKMMHPSNNIMKEYVAHTDKPFEKQLKAVFEQGIDIDGRQTSPAQVEYLGNNSYRVIIHEGRNREVRRLFEAAGHRVKKLKRTRIATLNLNDLKEGAWRYLEPCEVEQLKALK